MTDVPDLTLAGLPDPVRLRVVSLVAEALPEVATLPTSLRKVAGFAPARRARLGGTAIGAALESDEEFRDRVATQVAARHPVPDGAQEPVELASMTWLTRPEGWESTLAEVLARLAERPRPVGHEAAPALARLRDRLADAEAAVRELRARHRGQLEEYKSENSSLRRKLGESRTAARAAREEADRATLEAEEARAELAATRTSQDKELRRLRGQVEQLEAELASGRRAGRSERDEATLRARLLLDTVIDAAAGLQRELALPATTGSPGDRVEAELAEAGTRTPSSAGSLGATSPALLEQYLAMPRARLLVDGYNVSKTAWPSSSLEAQRIRLLNGLAPIVARTGAETTVVFDAGATSARPVVSSPRGVRVLFSPAGVIADDVLRDLVAAEPPGRVVVVVTGDQAIVTDVTRAGARVASAAALIGLLTRTP